VPKLTDAEHQELAQAVKMCQENGWKKAAFILGRAWSEEIKAGRKTRKRPGETTNGEGDK
jgi:hypothetical protein